MGSDSDLPVMGEAAKMLKKFGVPFELEISSAHRSPERTPAVRNHGHRAWPEGGYRRCGEGRRIWPE